MSTDLRPVAARRGSALIIVVGTLALIAVIAAFYVTLGRADTRVARGVEQGGAVDNVERQVAQLIMGTVGDDRLSVAIATVTNNESWVESDGTEEPTDRQQFIREATDYPYTDYTKVSIITDDPALRFVPSDYFNKSLAFNGFTSDAVERYRFRAAGDETTMLDLSDVLESFSIGPGDPSGLQDRRVGSDPWLSSSEPTFTGRLEFSFGSPIGHDARSYSYTASQQSNKPQAELFYLDNRDLAQISNLARDGLFVSLFNLRNNFNAESGLGFDASNRPRMSENRTLLTIDPATMMLRATDRLHIDGNGFGGSPIISILSTSPEGFAIKNTPAWWTMNQRFMHFPADPSFQILGRDVDAAGTPGGNSFLTLQTPAHPDFPDYQYVDANGSGFYDSRWIELTDSTLGPSGVQNLLSNETGLRFFMGIKVIDLSSMVNVNSATDGLVPATSLVSPGATPAEIDLRRLLTMQDQSEKYVPVFNNPNFTGTGQQRLSYDNIERLPFDAAQAQNPGSLVAADYEQYGTGLLLIAPNRLTGPGISTGRFAYDAIRRAIQGDRFALHPDSTSLRSPTGLAYEDQKLLDITPFEFYRFDPDYFAVPFASRNMFQSSGATLGDISRMARNRRDYWYNVGGSNIADPSDPPLTGEGFGGNLFGIEDLAELLVFHGLNDDRVLSPLERATQGRYDNGGAIGMMTTGFGPLRANRPTSLERQHDNWNNQDDPSATTSSGDNQIDYESMALMALNPRLRLTTLSGSTPLRRRAVQDINGDGILSASERRLTMEDARLDLTANPSAAQLFSLYAEALLPYGYVDSTWNRDPEGVMAPLRPGYNSMRTLSYGYRGSELALRISAHLAINMADMLDADDVPSVATVLTAPVAPSGGTGPRSLLDEDTGGQFTTARGMDSPYPWWTQGDRFDLGDDRLAPDASDVGNAGVGNDLNRTIYNVYGLEPQPFITEVSVVTVYSDVPRRATALSSGSIGFSGDPLLSDFVTEDLESPPDFSIPYTGNDPEDRSALYAGTTFGSGCSGGLFGYDSGTTDDVNIRVDTSGDNPDLMLHILAVQLTNPFDVAINLTDDEPAYVENPLNPLEMIPNRSFLRTMGPGAFLEQAKYYFEFNGHFFPLAEYIENMTNRNRADYVNSNQTGLYRIILEPGESRVVYVSAHASLNNLTERWRQIEEVYRNQVGDQGVLDASPLFLQTGSLSYVQNYIDDQFAVRGNSSDTNPLMGDDVRYPARVVPFNPTSGAVLASGPGSSRFVDFMRTNFAFRNTGASTTVNEIDRMRQEVRLWRKLTISDTNPIGIEREEFTGAPNDNWIGNDMLVDRMRDPAVADKYTVTTEATLDYATMDWEKIQRRNYITNANERFDPFTAGNMFWDTNNAKTIVDVGLSMSTNDIDRSWSFWGGTNQGLTIAMRAGYRRPDHLEEPTKDGLLGEDGLAVRGLLPAWCIEGIDHNYNIAQPSEIDSIGGIEGPKQIALAIEDAKNGGFLGEYFGFRGCHGRDDFPHDRDGARGGMFYMNFLRFVNDTKPMRTVAGFPDPAMMRVESIGYKGGTALIAGSGVSDPMLVPTITRHPAVKYRKRELIDGVADADGDGQLDEYNDDLELTEMLQSRIFPARNETYSAGKRTIALFNTDATLTDSEIIATVPALLTLGRDGLGEAADPRNVTVRLGDLAMPFGVGATFAPRSPAAPYLPRNYRIGEWTTFAEAMSAALGYEPVAFYTNSVNLTDPGEFRYSLLSELIDAKGTRIAPTPPDMLVETTPNFQRLFVLDRGRLDLQAFAPFVNLVEGIGTLTNVAPQFNPGVGGDYRVGFSEPPAQRLLSMGQAISRGGNPLTTPVIGTININTASDAVLRTIPGFATSMQFSESRLDYNRYFNGTDGIANLPVDAPLMEWAPGRAIGKTTFFFQAQAPVPGQDFKPPLGIGDPFGDYNQGFYLAGWRNVGEIPASLIAFRDRTRAEFRLAAKNVGGPGGAPPPQGGATRDPDVVFDFTPTLQLGFVPNSPFFATSILELTVGNFATDFSRSSINGQGASSELPGFSGTGSLLGLSIAKADPLTSNPPDIVNPRLQEQGGPGLNNNWRLSIIESAGQGTTDRFGKDGFAMSAIDQDINGQDDPLFDGNPTTLFTNEMADTLLADDNFSYTLGRAGFYNENPSIQTRQRSLEDEVLDDALEELAIFNGAANTIDVRSDFFAAWFVIRGYSKEDVESLDPSEPMRPTYQKRFLMVLDRSNVTEAGQLPKVLLLREVPL